MLNDLLRGSKQYKLNAYHISISIDFAHCSLNMQSFNNKHQAKECEAILVMKDMKMYGSSNAIFRMKEGLISELRGN